VFICDWSTREADFAKLNELLTIQLSSTRTVPCIQPFHSLAYPLSLAEMLKIAQRYARRALMNVALCDKSFKYRAKPKSVRLKIGYVSSDFGNHPLSHLMQSVFGLHNPSKYEVYCYSLSPSDKSHGEKRVERDAEHFVDVSHMHSAGQHFCPCMMLLCAVRLQPIVAWLKETLL
jgi:protein O-GlcNAc transferase